MFLFISWFLFIFYLFFLVWDVNQTQKWKENTSTSIYGIGSSFNYFYSMKVFFFQKEVKLKAKWNGMRLAKC